MSIEGLKNHPTRSARAALSGDLKASDHVAPSIAQTMLTNSSTWHWKKMPVVTIVSLFLHLGALGLLGLIVLKTPQLVDEIFTTVIENEEVAEPIVERSMLAIEEIKDAPLEDQISEEMASNFQFETTGSIDLNVSDDIPTIQKSSNDSPGPADIDPGEVTSGRMSAQAKKVMVQKFGGNSASEAAVVSGLKWLTNHQLSGGSWSFDHAKHPSCKGQCSQSGILKKCPNGATGLSLLAFLGAGHTHQTGDYKRQVKQALDFLIKSGKHSDKGLDLRGNVVSNEGMYVQGLCTIALCECAAMTRDPRIRKAAQGAIEFIVHAQNSKDGGWRYRPNDPGDTSVVGWQVMALKSGNSAKLEFPSKAFKGAEHFLDLVQSNRGTQYAYVPDSNGSRSEPTEAMTAVGLLCRMYLGWDRTNPKLAGGIEYLDSVKPQPDNMYFNYYATQVMHHWGGDEWNRWNDVMRDQLVRTQRSQKEGHLAGSWDVADPHGGSGGRLYMTCLSVMTLEVYYRHLPLYNSESIKVEF